MKLKLLFQTKRERCEFFKYIYVAHCKSFKNSNNKKEKKKETHRYITIGKLASVKKLCAEIKKKRKEELARESKKFYAFASK